MGSWLSKTVRQVLPKTTPHKKSKKLKNVKNGGGSTIDENELDLWEYLSLARTVSEGHPPVEVPKNIVQSLRSIVGRRKKCAKWFAQQSGNNSHESSNSSHAHAITIFEQVLRLLSPRDVDAVEKNQDKVAASVSRDPRLTNLFAALDVEDVLTDDEESIPSLSPSSPEKSLPACTPSQPCYKCRNCQVRLTYAPNLVGEQSARNNFLHIAYVTNQTRQ